MITKLMIVTIISARCRCGCSLVAFSLADAADFSTDFPLIDATFCVGEADTALCDGDCCIFVSGLLEASEKPDKYSPAVNIQNMNPVFKFNILSIIFTTFWGKWNTQKNDIDPCVQESISLFVWNCVE